MKKQLIVFGIIVLLVTVGFSGCFDSNTDSDKIVGTWRSTYPVGVMTFFSNGTGAAPNDFMFTWELKDGKFIMQYGQKTTMTYNYSFSDDGNKFTFTDPGTGTSLTFTKESPDFTFLHLEPGYTVDISGEVIGVNYINTSYGSLPVIILNNSIGCFMEANLIDDDIYDIYDWRDSIELYGVMDKKYNEEDNINTVLHFEEFQLNNAKFLWAKEFGIYLKLLSAIDKAIDNTACIIGLSLKWISSDGKGNSSFEVITTNQDQYSLNLLNVSLKKTSYDLDSDPQKYECGLFSTLVNNLFNISRTEYLTITAGGGEKIDYMNSLDEGVSQSGLIQFIDKNSNGLIDDHDVFNLSIPPTQDDTKLETYFLLIGKDFRNTNDIAVAAGVTYLINWYDGIYEEITEKEWMAIKCVSYQENNSLIDTTLRISRVISNENSSIQNYDVNLVINNTNLHGNLDVGNMIQENDIFVDFVDSNNNEILDIDDLFLVNGLEGTESAYLYIYSDNGDMVAYYSWVVGEGC